MFPIAKIPKIRNSPKNILSLVCSSTAVDSKPQVQLLAKEDNTAIEDVKYVHDNHYDSRIDDELRKIIADIFAANAKLRKLVNSQLRHRLKYGI
ncbi:hypothetical protein V6N11_064681 [Hibiscus sabdariffa]|uniref:Uncharacterized protein n=1 Tax=Hibiscus sabdariffa TaxID=183260 RepID=A0ABR2NB95_9ROSI